MISQKPLTQILTTEELEILKEHCKKYNKTVTKALKEWLDFIEKKAPSKEELLQEIEDLQQQVKTLKQEKADLEILLEATTEHTSAVEEELEDETLELKRESEERFRAITEATPTPIVVSSIVSGKILYANTSTLNTFGVSLEELKSRPTTDFYYNPNERQHLLDLFFRDGYIEGYEIPAKKADGRVFWVTVSIRPFKFNGENTLLSAFFDITQRKQAEEALRIAEENYRSIFQNALEGMFQTTPDRKYLNVNPAMAKIHGYSSPEEMMVTVQDISQQLYVDPTLRDEFKRLMEQNNYVSGFQYQVYRQDGRKIWVEEHTRAVRDAQGNLLHYEGIIQDITQRKQEEEEMKRQMQQLRIEIDQQKLQSEVKSLANTDYFKAIQAEIKNMRIS